MMDDETFMQSIKDLKEWGVIEVNGTKVKLTEKGRELGEKYKRLEQEEMARSNFTKPKDMPMDTLADRINSWSSSNTTHSGRGHGRATSHGRHGYRNGRPQRASLRTPKREMLYFVRDMVKGWRNYNAPMNPHEKYTGYWPSMGSYAWANILAQQTQFFDCSDIFPYVYDTYTEQFPDMDVPPMPEAVLPADNVGLYLHHPDDKGNTIEMMFWCLSLPNYAEDSPYFRRHYGIYHLHFMYELDQLPMPQPVAEVMVAENDCRFIDVLQGVSMQKDLDDAKEIGMRQVVSLLRLINTPRFVMAGKREVSGVKRQSFKKAAGKFVPDAWNMVSWNVDKPVKAKDYKEGTGNRLPLHYRRGHWRMAEEGWKNTRWSAERNRWEQYIHGYEAGNPAFGWKKNYHLPRKEH
jgi:hypothetical protein